MLSFRASLAVVLFAAVTANPVFASTTHHARRSSHASAGKSSTSSTHKKSSSASKRKSSGDGAQTVARGKRGSHKAAPKSRKLRGQQAIAPERVTQIQQALIREHYLDGDANGEWNETTKAAMQKYQADQGWQTKLMPDSRALKKLGLGPDYSNAINAKSASFGEPPAASTIPADQSSGFASAAGVNR